jgi:PAS domain S-box-containing protein
MSAAEETASPTGWVEVDHLGTVLAVNARFTADFGWTPDEIVGRPLLTLMPEHYHDAHNLGFSRFVQFGRANILGQPLTLPILRPDGESVMSETCIEAERRAGNWCFRAQVVPLELAGGRP